MSTITPSDSGAPLRLIIGIDYGTTYSGISMALSSASSFNEIHTWTEYPGASANVARHCEKAPSRIAFASENEDLQGNAWGYMVDPGMKAYSWTKLILDNKALPAEYDDPNLQNAIGSGIMKLPTGKTAKDLVTAYLRGLNENFNQKATETYGEVLLSTLPTDVWLTVPATWSEAAKLTTRDAARDAGFASRPGDRLMLIPEPEAAAHMALRATDNMDRVHDLVKKGTGVMVCDLGGGTVDITTYQVQETTPRLELDEMCVGAGGKCGSTFVDRNFHQLMTERFGTAFTSLGSHMIGPGSRFMNEFENVKCDFNTTKPSKRASRLQLHMKGLVMTPRLQRYYDDDARHVIVTHEDMLRLFEPVVDMVIRLVSEQNHRSVQESDKSIKTIVLVGGFSSSAYVKERLREWARQSSIHMTTGILNPWSAVVHGAVLRGIEGSSITKKKCRRHYGYDISHLYRPEIHTYDSEQRHVWHSPFNNREYLTGFFDWKVKKGDMLDDTSNITDAFPYLVKWPLNGIHIHELYACSLDRAPESIENEGWEQVGEIEFTLDHVDFSKITDTVVDEEGVRRYELCLEIDIRLSDESGLLVFKILCQGKECGSAKLGFSYS